MGHDKGILSLNKNGINQIMIIKKLAIHKTSQQRKHFYCGNYNGINILEKNISGNTKND